MKLCAHVFVSLYICLDAFFAGWFDHLRDSVAIVYD